MSIKKMVESPHPIFTKYYDFWQFLLESYEGGLDYTKAKINSSGLDKGGLMSYLFQIFVNGKKFNPETTGGNLFQHPKEREADYQRRLDMSYYYNFCGPVIDIYNNHLFKQPVVEEWGNLEGIIKNQEENIDRKNGSIVEFRKEMSDYAQIYGHVFVVCDKPAADSSIVTEADKLAKGHYPYFTLFHPQNVLNWSLDSFGFPYWVLLRETVGANISPDNYDPDKRLDVTYRLWTREGWTLYDKEYNQVGAGTHNAGQVPVECIFDKKSKKARNFLGISFISDVSLIARDIYNSCSELKQILRDQTFAFLAVQGDSTEYNELEIGTGRGLLYPMDRALPAYVSPPTGNAEIYFKHIDRQINKIFQIAKIEPGSAQFEGQNTVEQSGVSKAWDFNQTNSALSQKAGSFEDGENRLWQLYAKWENKEWDGNVTYPREFSIQSLNDDLVEAEMLSKRQLGEEFEAEINKVIVQKKFPRMPDNEVDKIIEQSKTVVTEAKDNGAGSNKLKDRFPGLFTTNSKEGNA